MKKEVLEALAQVFVECEDGFDFEGDIFVSESFEKEVESENYWIDLHFTVTVRYTNHREFEYEAFDIDEFKVWDKFGNEIKTDTITDDEIEQNININL